MEVYPFTNEGPRIYGVGAPRVPINAFLTESIPLFFFYSPHTGQWNNY
jgi:hypothetical protein